MARRKVGRPSRSGPMVVGERFRIILPQPVRDALGVNVGDQVGFEIRGSTVELYRVEMRRASQ